MKGTDMKSVPAAQLAGLQSQGYKVMGDDETEPTVSENGPETAPDGHSPELEALMKKYGVEGDDVDEGMKEKIGGMLRRQGQKDHPLQNRRDVAHRKAGDAYAAGDTKNGKRYMDWRQKSADKDKIDLAHAPFEGAEAAPDGHSPELEALMKKYGVEGEVDEGMKEKISGMMRRMREKGGFGKSRADLVHRKANVAYALGDKKAGDRYMGVLNKGAVRSAQKAVATWLMQKNIGFESCNRSILGGKELDFYFPNHNIAIEFQGDFWHGSDRMFLESDIHPVTKKPISEIRKADRQKIKICKDLGIELLWIWEYDWNLKKEVIKNQICNKLGIVN